MRRNKNLFLVHCVSEKSPHIIFLITPSKPSDFYDFWYTISSWNLTPDNKKFAHLTCTLWLHYLEKYEKSYFDNVIHTCVWIFKLSSKMDYSCHNAAVSVLLLSARIQLQSLLCHCLIISSMMLCWNQVHVSTSRFRNSTTSYVVHGNRLLYHTPVM